MAGRSSTALILLACGLACACAAEGVVERRWPVMGTFARVELRADRRDVSDAAVETVRRAFADVDASMSNWRPDTTLSRLNVAARTDESAVDDGDLRKCLAAAFEAARVTGGAFDPTVGPLMTLYGFRPHAPRVPPEEELESVRAAVGWTKVILGPEARTVRFVDPRSEIDLGGIAKGYALDLARERLEGEPLRGALLDLGGNILTWGTPPDGKAWRVGVRDPIAADRLAALVRITAGAVATSGDYENRFVVEGRTIGHIMDARSGRPATTDVVSASAIGPSATTADALSTALYVAGSGAAASLLEANPGFEAVLIVRDDDGFAVIASRSLEGRVGLDAEFGRGVAGSVRFRLPPAR